MNGRSECDTAQLLRLLVDHVPSMLAYWDRDLRCRFANRAYERWFGVDPDRLVGRTLPELLGPALFQLNEPYVREALAGRQQVFERVVPGPDGTQRAGLATYVPDIVDGEVLGFVASVTEVTLLKEAEAALRAEAAQRERAMAQLHESRAALVEAQRLGGVGNWEWEIEPDITSWSEGLYRIFGRDPAHLPPTFAEHGRLYAPQSWARLQAAVAAALHSGAPYTLELEYLRADGQAGWLEARGEAVRDETGAITRLRGTAHEVTARHRMEEARVEARAAEAASLQQSQLLSRVSHELRTPLNAILGFSRLCERDATLGDKHRRWAASIHGAGRHMLQLVDEVLDLSEAEAGRLALQAAPVPLAPVLDAGLVAVADAARAGGVTLRGVDTAAADVAVQGDAQRLRQVVDHLLSNAVKYTRAGGTVEVFVSAHGDSVELTVQDNGVGLTAAQRERLFTPFERLGAERTTVPGTGLGLALSRRLVERMGGRIRVDSEAGRGSRFTVELPRAP